MKPSIPLMSIGLVALALLVASSAQASTPRATRGDAQAVLEAFPSGGWVIRLHAGRIVGAPAAFTPDDGVRIAPIPGVFDGIHYCSLDWHVIAITSIDGNAPGESRTPSQIAAWLATTADVLWLDGTPLDTARTPVKRFLNPDRFGLLDAYSYATGRVMAPADLSIGPHTLRDVYLEAGSVIDTVEITFFIDAPGEAACL
jgi:hypothetical protein